MAHTDNVTIDVCIFLSILWPLTIPLYIYGFSKWHQFRHHFLICKRFPKITYFLGVAAILEHLLILCTFWLHYYNIYNSVTLFLVSSCEAFMFAALSIVLYRIFLVYLTWKQLQNTLNLVVDIDVNNKTKTDIATKPYYHKLSYCFITFILIGTIIIMFKEYIYVTINRAAWTGIVIVGIILSIFLRVQKVKEGIGLLLESRIIVADVIAILILLQFESYNKVLAHCSHYLQIFSILLWCLMPLYLTLYYIYKFEGSLTYKHDKDVTGIKKTPIPGNRKTNNIIPDNKSIEHVLDMMTKTDKTTESNNRASVKDLNQSFEVFLESYENYKLFAGYLRHCFAIENLLFLVRVCIFNAIVNELNDQQREIYSSDDEMDTQMTEIKNNDSIASANDAGILATTNSSINDHENVLPRSNPLQLIHALSLSSSASNSLRSHNLKKIPKLKFEFLTNIYDEYKKIINDNENNNVGNFLYYKNGIDIIVSKICDQFVINEAVNMVNIAYNTRVKIMDVIEDKNYFKNYDSYSHLFDDALAEIFQLNQSLYNYRFRSYVDESLMYQE